MNQHAVIYPSLCWTNGPWGVSQKNLTNRLNSVQKKEETNFEKKLQMMSHHERGLLMMIIIRAL